MHSPYQQLRKPVKIDIHPLDLGKGGKWIKPVSAAVSIPEDVLEVLEKDIEKRHAAGSKAEEVLWIQPPRPLKETIRGSWAAGLSLCSIMIGLFSGAGIGVAAPIYLVGTAIIPPIIAIIVCAVLANRVRCDLKGWYALTRSRAIIVVPESHCFGLFKSIVLSFEFTLERSLIVQKIEHAGVHEVILKREPRLVDFFHTKHSTGEVTFYPRTKLQIPFYWSNIQHSHAFEMVFNDTVLNSTAPTNGGHVSLDKQNSFQEQKKAAKKHKFYPLIGALWILLLVGSVTAPAWSIWSQAVTRTPTSIAIVVLAWIFVQLTLFATFYPLYRYGRAKNEARANGRYMRFMVDAR